MECVGVLQDLTQLSSLLHGFVQLYSEKALEIEDTSNGPDSILQCSVHQNGLRGRPAYIISRVQLETLIELGYNYSKIARMFGVSERTLLRRRLKYDLPVGHTFTSITDNDLDIAISSILRVLNLKPLTLLYKTVVQLMGSVCVSNLSDSAGCHGAYNSSSIISNLPLHSHTQAHTPVYHSHPHIYTYISTFACICSVCTHTHLCIHMNSHKWYCTSVHLGNYAFWSIDDKRFAISWNNYTLPMCSGFYA